MNARNEYWQRVLKELAQLQRREKELRHQFDNLLNGLVIINSMPSVQEMFMRLLEVLKQMIAFDDAFILRKEKNEFHPIVSTSDIFDAIKWDAAEMTRHIFDGQIIPLTTVDDTPEWQSQPPLVREKVKSALHAPLHTSYTEAVLICVSRRKGYFDSSHSDLLEKFSPIVSQALYNLAAQERLNAAKERAEAATKLKSQFLANMSHELRTPLNSIIGFTELTLKTELTNKQKNYLRNVKVSSDNLLGVINDILDFSKIEAGRLKIDSVPFRLDQLLEDIASIFAHRAAEKGIELIIPDTTDIPTALVGDPIRVKQVFVNLVGNALKFTSEGEVAVFVELVEKKFNLVTLRFLVRDTGIGIREDLLPKLFDSFFQADISKTRRFGGTGLGLTISKQLVQWMGGEIWVESKEGEGSIFCFSLSFKRHFDMARKSYDLPEFIRKIRILVVDDCETVRLMLGLLLTRFGFDVQTVASGEEALALLVKQNASRPFGLVILDWRMSGMDGVETFGRIKASPINPQPKIIMMSAFGTDKQIRKVVANGVDGVLVKPIKKGGLHQALLEVFGQEPMEEHRLEKNQPSQNHEDYVPLKGKRVLLVEDSLLSLQLASELLEGFGLTVETANNGKEALETLQKRHFDAVLMDVQMPEMDGFQATRLIRNNGVKASLPIIALTAHTMKGDRERCLKAGMNDYVSKPVDIDELYRTMAKWLSKAAGIPPPTRPDQRARGKVSMDWKTSPEIDVQAALKRVRGNETLYKSLLMTFRRQNVDFLNLLNEMLQKGEVPQALKAVHTLKGEAGNLSAVKLFTSAVRLESVLKQGIPPFDRELDAFSHNFRILMEMIAQNEGVSTF